MTDVFAEWVEKAARAHHLATCDRPACLHVPFDEDRDTVRRTLDLLRPDIDALAHERDSLVEQIIDWRSVDRRLADALGLERGPAPTYAEVVERAATEYHRRWCTIPYCVHTPFPADRELAETMLGPVRGQLESNELTERRARMDEAVTKIGGRL